LRIAAPPDAGVTASSNSSLTAAGAEASTAPSAGTERMSVACARAAAGAASEARTNKSRTNRERTALLKFKR
jgi:hypothetical protein